MWAGWVKMVFWPLNIVWDAVLQSCFWVCLDSMALQGFHSYQAMKLATYRCASWRLLVDRLLCCWVIVDRRCVGEPSRWRSLTFAGDKWHAHGRSSVSVIHRQLRSTYKRSWNFAFETERDGERWTGGEVSGGVDDSAATRSVMTTHQALHPCRGHRSCVLIPWSLVSTNSQLWRCSTWEKLKIRQEQSWKQRHGNSQAEWLDLFMPSSTRKCFVLHQVLCTTLGVNKARLARIDSNAGQDEVIQMSK